MHSAGRTRIAEADPPSSAPFTLSLSKGMYVVEEVFAGLLPLGRG